MEKRKKNWLIKREIIAIYSSEHTVMDNINAVTKLPVGDEIAMLIAPN